MEFLYWHCTHLDNPATDVKWAAKRFNMRFDRDPVELLVHPLKEQDYQDLGLDLEIKPDKRIQSNYIGLV